MKKNITMSAKEIERVTVLDNLVAKRIKQKHAASQLGLSARQVQRIFTRYRKEGAIGLIHKNRGRKSNREIPQREKDRVIDLIKRYYHDFRPTFAHEKLVENHGVVFSDETLRKIMTEADIWKPKRRKLKKLHPYRERRACAGELIQLDGSPHAWFEDRWSECTLLAFIDDATSRIMDGEFVDYEGTFTFFSATEHYLLTHGKPLAYYVDKHSTFKVNRQATIEEQLKDVMPCSQFARVMDNLGIELIFAHSPQAKGRAERLFETLQDRLVKELRLEGIENKEDGTRYFREVYIPKHNAKFAVTAKDPANLHRPLLESNDLARIFTVQSKRKVSKDLIVQYKNTRFQLTPENGYRYTLRHQAIIVEEDRSGNLVFRYKDRAIPYKIIQAKVQKSKPVQVVSSKEFKERRVYIPRPDHPWKRVFLTIAEEKRPAEMT